MIKLFQHQQFKSKYFYYSTKNSEPEFVYKRQPLGRGGSQLTMLIL